MCVVRVVCFVCSLRPKCTTSAGWAGQMNGAWMLLAMCVLVCVVVCWCVLVCVGVCIGVCRCV